MKIYSYIFFEEKQENGLTWVKMHEGIIKSHLKPDSLIIPLVKKLG